MADATREQPEQRAGPHTTARHRGEGRGRLRPALEGAAATVNAEWIVPAVLRPDTVDVAIRRRSAGPR
ncbi:hypothetical protein ACFQ51_00340 [Streptomyces kaempferi]